MTEIDKSEPELKFEIDIFESKSVYLSAKME